MHKDGTKRHWKGACLASESRNKKPVLPLLYLSWERERLKILPFCSDHEQQWKPQKSWAGGLQISVGG